jgi:hypothetical protein
MNFMEAATMGTEIATSAKPVRRPLAQEGEPDAITLDAQQVRAKLLDGRVDDKTLAAALGIGLRMLYEHADRGLPFIRLGRRRYFRISEAEAWLSQQRQRRSVTQAEPQPRPAPRPVGRPRKQA